MAGGIKGIVVKIGGDTTELGKSLSEATKKSTALKTELKGVNTLLKFDPKNITLLKQKSDLLKESISATESKLKSLKEVLAKADSGEIKLTAEEYRNLQREIASTENKLKGLKEESKAFGSVGAQQIAQVGEKLQKVGGTVESVGKKFSVISGAAGAVLGGSVMLASNFEDAMAKVNTIADTSAVSLDDLTGQIMDLSNQTGISAEDIADATYNAISAGQNTADAVSFVANATSLAKAGFTDTASAIDVLTTIMNAYGLEASEVGKVSDMLINTQNKGKTTVAELASSMGKVIPTAKSMNVGLDQLSAGYAIMTAKGIATAESTTYMNSMLNELGKGGTGVSNILKEKTGKSFQELMAGGKSLGDVLQILQDYANESGKSFNDLWSSSEAGKAGLTLLSGGVGEFNAMAKDMVASTGATSEAMSKLETPSQKAKVAMTQLKNAGITLGQTALSALSPLIDNLASGVEKLTKWFTSLSPGIQQVILVVLALVTALGPVLIFVGKLISSVGTIMTMAPQIQSAITALSGGLKALWGVMMANPITIVIALIAALVAALVYAYNHSETFRDIVNSAFQKVKEVVGGVVDTLVVFFTQTIPSAMTALYNFISPILDGIATVFSTVWNGIKTVVSTVVEAIKTILMVGFAIIMNILVPIINGYLTLFTTVFNGIKSVVTTVINFLSPFITGAWNTIKSVTSTVWNGIKSVISTVWNGIKTAVSTPINWIKSTVTSVWESIKSATSSAWNAIKSAITGPIEAAKNTVGNIIDKIKHTVKNIFNGIKPKLHLSLPKVSVSAGKAPWGIGGKGELPSFSVKWNKLGAVFNRPTIFPTDLGFQGVGEAGPEAVAPIDVLQKYVAEAVDNRNASLERKLDQVISLMSNYYPSALDAMDRPVVVGVNSVDSALSDRNSKVSRGW